MSAARAEHRSAPTDAALAAQTRLNDTALPEVENRFGVSGATVRDLAELAADELLAALGAPPTGHAGWAMLVTGAALSGNAERLSPRGASDEPSFDVGLAWAGLIAGAAGDRIVARVEAEAEAGTEAGAGQAPTPGGGRERVRALARELTDTALASTASPEDRRAFAERTIAQLDASVHQLDHEIAGWTVCAGGGLLASRAADITGPLQQRRGLLRRGPELPRVTDGCGYAGALLAQVGLILIEGR